MPQTEMMHDGWARRHRGKFLIRRNIAHLDRVLDVKARIAEHSETVRVAA